MPSAPRLNAMLLVIALTPPLAAAYISVFGKVASAWLEEILIIEPFRFSFIYGMTYLLHKKGPLKSILIKFSQSASVASSIDLKTVMPALFTNVRSEERRVGKVCTSLA